MMSPAVSVKTEEFYVWTTLPYLSNENNMKVKKINALTLSCVIGAALFHSPAIAMMGGGGGCMMGCTTTVIDPPRGAAFKDPEVMPN
ncbi:MAG: hypothetical protein ACXWTP_13975, partial [Methylosarcina sp.]